MKRLSIADIKATEILSIGEKKMIVGGISNYNGPDLSGHCEVYIDHADTYDIGNGWKAGSNTYHGTGMSRSAARAFASKHHGHWCCGSCGKASWNN